MALIIDSWRILAFVCVQLLIAVTNMRTVPRLSRFAPGAGHPRVSVLVPARNEQDNIVAAVSSLTAQEYPDFELLVLDDESVDDTVAKAWAAGRGNVRVVQGKPLPPGWNGKPWACHQLAAAATGELLFFTDADTVHHPETLARAVAALQELRADLLTAITGVRMRSMGELLTVPFPLWSIFTLLPLPLAYRLCKNRALVAANGKFLLIRRKAYELVGGHAAARDHAAEDMDIARRVKKAGLCWRLVNATAFVSSRMYASWSEARQGFAKNYFALFDYRLLPALFVWSWMLLITWHPLLTLLAGLGRGAFAGSVVAALLTVGVNCFLWVLVARATRMPQGVAFFGPAIITASALIGFESVVRMLTGTATWKDRILAKRKWRFV
ncbi:MAG: glycosyltransferase [candidate division KSB1 bacterium]|nr:glycosyltransferase [candidate division KSB1 bacterium]